MLSMNHLLNLIKVAIMLANSQNLNSMEKEKSIIKASSMMEIGLMEKEKAKENNIQLNSIIAFKVKCIKYRQVFQRS